MFTAIAYAAEGVAAGTPQSPIGAFLPVILIFGIFYFLLIRPQQKKAKEHTKSLESMKAGDDVLTSGGIFGKVFKVDDDRVIVEIADKVKVSVAKAQLYPQGSKSKCPVKKEDKAGKKKDK